MPNIETQRARERVPRRRDAVSRCISRRRVGFCRRRKAIYSETGETGSVVEYEYVLNQSLTDVTVKPKRTVSNIVKYVFFFCFSGRLKGRFQSTLDCKTNTRDRYLRHSRYPLRDNMYLSIDIFALFCFFAKFIDLRLIMLIERERVTRNYSLVLLSVRSCFVMFNDLLLIIAAKAM